MKKLLITGTLIASLVVPTFAATTNTEGEQAKSADGLKPKFRNKIFMKEGIKSGEYRELMKKLANGEITFDEFKEEVKKIIPEGKNVDFDKIKEKIQNMKEGLKLGEHRELMKKLIEGEITFDEFKEEFQKLIPEGKEVDFDKIKEKVEEIKERKAIYEEYFKGDITIDECITKLKEEGCKIADDEKFKEVLEIKKKCQNGEITKEEARKLLPQKGDKKRGEFRKKLTKQMKEIRDICSKYMNGEITKEELKEQLTKNSADNIDNKIQILELKKQFKDGTITKEQLMEKIKELVK
ncbi:hypothetical protein PV797_04490 [Clostridiaceae bacterium M8S5]|nr:hypothetical protein PV797_04490 [Clostridiaceae bacterium M8S5]